MLNVFSPFQTGWPACENKCSVPLTQAGYDQYSQADLIDVGDNITFSCTRANAYTGTPPDATGWNLASAFSIFIMRLVTFQEVFLNFPIQLVLR